MKRFLLARLHSFAVLLATATFIGGFGHEARAEGRPIIALTDRGPVSGVPAASGSKFLGIPYAAAPVGALRFRPPEPHSRWQGTRPANRFGAGCPQRASDPGAPEQSEDCLFLNVFTPDADPQRSSHRFPVMVFLHGGGLESGASNPYEPTKLVAQGTVVVTINYRLGALGFLAHPALTRESPEAASGNYGLMDQQQALRWVRNNIAHFSGDPRNVTVFGQSAGGLSVLAQLASPLAAGLFQRAIAQSGSYSMSQRSLTTAEAEGESLAAAVGCTSQDAACLRNVPVEALIANQPQARTETLPMVDGKVLPQSIIAALKSGQFNRVPTLLGSTHDEMTIYVARYADLASGPVSAASYPTAVATWLSAPAEVVALVVAQYPPANYVSPGAALASITTDAAFACNARTQAQLLAQYVPVFLYEFDDPDAPAYLPSVSFPYGAYHGSDLQYLFSTTFSGQPNPPPFTPDQARLSDTMVRYWSQFARWANPNGFGTPNWRRYDPTQDAVQLLTPPRPEGYSGFAADHKCAFWAALGG